MHGQTIAESCWGKRLVAGGGLATSARPFKQPAREVRDDPHRAMDGDSRKRALEQQMETAKRRAIRARQLVTNLEAHAKDCEEA